MDTTVFSVMSFNVWGLHVGGLTLAEDIDGRLKAMVHPIRDLDPDIIAFQEVWSDAIWRHLVEELDYPFFAYRPNRGWVRGQLGNGLLVLSRFPLARERIRRFSALTRTQEVLASKGAMLVDLVTPQGPVTLINTHLGSGFTARMAKRRVVQLHELFGWVADIPREHPVILAGDLNLNPHSETYELLCEWVETRYDEVSGDTFRQANLGEPGYTYYRSRSRGRNGTDQCELAERLDYIFVLCSLESTVRIAVLESAVVLDVPESPLSDHCGVLTRMEIAPVSAGSVESQEGRNFTAM
ncbi:MAG: endonuclease/exonuclease/phosphatase family protein [Candidatus Methylomirabilis sp.]